jgi:RimJ/RimL family protein N-acetyltransferase
MLKSERVTLRAVERADIVRLHELQRNVDLIVFGYGQWLPKPLAMLERLYERYLEDPDPAWFAIEIGGTYVGECSLHDRDRRSGVAALGIGIYDPAYVGSGYGREAAALLLDWAFDIQNYQRIWLDTDATNARALRCYASLGFVEEGRLRGQNIADGRPSDVVLMGLLRDEWRAHQRGRNHATR